MCRVAAGVALATVLIAAPARAAELHLEMSGGYVTLVASEAPLRQILAEWERVGGTRIVNGDRVAGPPVTIRLERVPEQQALAVLLRSVAGYLAAPRRAGNPGASAYESVMILATSTPPAAPAAAAARVGAAPGPRPFPMPQDVGPPIMPVPDEQPVESEGFITVGSTPTPRQSPPAAGSAAQPQTGALPPGVMPPGAIPPGAMPPGAMPPGAMPPGAAPAFPFRPGTTTTATPGFRRPTGIGTGQPQRPGTVQPGVLLPNDGPPDQANPNLQQ
jgi:hypothetical protein